MALKIGDKAVVIALGKEDAHYGNYNPSIIGKTVIVSNTHNLKHIGAGWYQGLSLTGKWYNSNGDVVTSGIFYRVRLKKVK